MQLINEEIKKIYIKNKMLFLAVALIAASIISMLFKDLVPSISENAIIGSAFEEIKLLGGNMYAFGKLLSQTGINVFALIFSLAFSVVTVNYEEKNEMTALLLPTEKGNRKVPDIKVITLILSVAVFCLTIFICDFSVISLKYGPADMNLPLQTLPDFTDTQKNLTLFSAFLLKSLMQTTGYVVLSLITMCLVKVFRGKTSAALTISVCSILVPLFLGTTVYNQERLYLLPSPLSLMLSGAFLKPTIEETGTENIIFRELTYGQLIFTLITVTLTGVICALIYLHLAYGKANAKKVPNKKKAMSTAVLLMSILMLSGCSSVPTEISYESGRNIIIDYENYYDTKTHTVCSINPTPMDSRLLLFIQGDTAFWKKTDVSSSSVCVYTTDLSTYKESSLLNSGGSNDYDGLLGLDMLFPSMSSETFNADIPRINQDSWYCDGKIYTFENDTLKSIDTESGEIEICLSDYNIIAVKRYGNSIYFSDEEKGLFKCSLNLEKPVLTDEGIKTFSYIVIGENILYSKDENTVCVSGDNSVSIRAKHDIIPIYSVGKKLILRSDETGRYYSFDTSKKNAKLYEICESPEAEFLCADEEGLAFFGYDENDEVVIIRLKCQFQ